MYETLIRNATETDAQAWRVRFMAAAPKDQSVFHVISEPRKTVATWEPIDPVAPPPRYDDDGGRSLAILWLPPNAPDRAAAAWLEGIPPEGAGGGPRVVRAGVRTARVVWTNARCIIYTSPELVDDALDAVTRFTLAERDTGDLETEMATISARFPADARLIHTASVRDAVQNRRRVGELSERMAALSASAMHIETALEQLDADLSLPSKRLYSELALQGALYDRLEVLEKPLEFGIHYYSAINTRLIEAAQWSKSDGYVIAILVVLFAEFLVNLYPLLFPS